MVAAAFGSTFNRDLRRSQDASISRFLPLPGLLLATAITIALLVGDASNRTYRGGFSHFVVNFRATTQIIVQVLSFALGAIHIYVLTTLVNFSTRLSLRRVPRSLDSIKLWNSMCSPRMDWSLPYILLIILSLFLILTVVPPALWAGALTPITTSAQVETTVNVPMYGPDPTKSYWNKTWDPYDSANITRNAYGSFSYVPGSAFSGVILDTAASASARNKSVRTHTKNDASRYSYHGRSYGVGSSVGLTFFRANEAASGGLKGMKYYEAGYQTNATCINNATNQFVVTLQLESDDGTYPDAYLASGPLPNSPPGKGEGYASVSLGGTSSTVVALVGNSENKRSVFAIAGGYDPGPYIALNNTQCDIIFTPTLFEIKVDASNLLISVTPEDTTKDIDPTSSKFGIGLGHLVQYVVREVTLLSMINTSLYTSILGDVLLSNIANVATATGTSTSDVSTVNSAVKESMESMLDDMLVAMSSAQLMIAGPVTPSTSIKSVPGMSTVQAVKIGQRGYIIAIFALNAMLLLLWTAEALRTKGWRDLPAFDYRDVKNVVVSTSVGGRAVATAAKTGLKNDGGRIKVVLERQGDARLALLLASHPGDVTEMTPSPSLPSTIPSLKTLTPAQRYSRLSSTEDATVGLHERSRSGEEDGPGGWAESN